MKDTICKNIVGILKKWEEKEEKSLQKNIQECQRGKSSSFCVICAKYVHK